MEHCEMKLKSKLLCPIHFMLVAGSVFGLYFIHFYRSFSYWQYLVATNNRAIDLHQTPPDNLLKNIVLTF